MASVVGELHSTTDPTTMDLFSGVQFDFTINPGNPLYEKAYFKVQNVKQYDTTKDAVKKVEIDWERYDLIDNNGNLETMSSNFNDLEDVSQILVYVIIGASSIILLLVFVFWLKNRTQEIGILLALGTSKIRILGQILLEALLIAALAITLSFTVAPSVSKITANYLVEQQAQQENEQKLLDKGKVARSSLEDSEQTVTGVNVTISPQIMLLDSSCVVIMILFSVGISGIMIVRRNPRDIFSELS